MNTRNRKILAGRVLAAALALGAAGLPSAPARAARGSSDTAPGEILVKLRSDAALNPLLVRYGMTMMDRFGNRPIYRLKVIGTGSVGGIIGSLSLEPDVLIAEPNYLQQTPEARKNQPWAIGTPQAFATQWAPDAMRLPDARQIASGAGVRVAVLDTGVDARHPMLQGRLLPGFDFVDFDNDPSEVGGPLNSGFGHGTHVAGLIAMVAPGAQIMPFRVLDADGVGNVWVLGEALLKAVDPDGNPDTDDGAHVVNMSLGTLSRTRLFDSVTQLASCTPADPSLPETDDSDPGYAADKARCSRFGGVVIVAASGNDASDNIREYPAAERFKGLIAVAASDANRRLARFSNFGSWIPLAAPGEALTSAIPGGLIATWSGTSMAAPLVAGVAALLHQSEPGLTADEIVRRIQRNSATLCGPTQIRLLDAANALGAAPAASPTCR